MNNKWKFIGAITVVFLSCFSMRPFYSVNEFNNPKDRHIIPVTSDNYLASNLPVNKKTAYIPECYKELIFEINKETKIPLLYIANWIIGESSWDKNCVHLNKKDNTFDFGLSQINSKNLGEFAIKYNEGQVFNPFNAYDSLKIGMRHVRYLYNKYHDWQLAFTAYNKGEGTVDRKGVRVSDYGNKIVSLNN
jgi:soluble lytic murein transglycosylase-like protein